MSDKCKCPGTRTLHGDVVGGSAWVANERAAELAAKGFAGGALALAEAAAKAAAQKIECEHGPEGQLCYAKVFAPVLEKWTATGAVRTPPAPYGGWLARGGCTWKITVACEVIELAEVENWIGGGKTG